MRRFYLLMGKRRADMRQKRLGDYCFFPYPVPESFLPAEAFVPFLAASEDLRELTEALVRFGVGAGRGGNFLVVCDDNTRDALGRDLAEILGADVLCHVNGLKPLRKHAEEVAARASCAKAVLAVGTGTVNDICKLGGHMAGVPYAVFPTGLSMNGFCSANASVVEDGGLKTSVPAAPPRAVLLHEGTLARAPARLLRAGIGDVACYAACRFDWLLSRCLTGTAYDERPYDMLRPLLPALYGGLAGEPRRQARFMPALAVSGIGMNLAGGSYPASQAEHVLCHLYDTVYPDNVLLHGEKVAAALPASVRVQMLAYVQAKGGVFSARAYERGLRSRLAALRGACPVLRRLLPHMRRVASVKAQTMRAERAGFPPRGLRLLSDDARFFDMATAVPVFRDRFTAFDMAGPRAK
jgi:glycerol dehydrogenase-like iron-containing ADH family enzyme